MCGMKNDSKNKPKNKKKTQARRDAGKPRRAKGAEASQLAGSAPDAKGSRASDARGAKGSRARAASAPVSNRAGKCGEAAGKPQRKKAGSRTAPGDTRARTGSRPGKQRPRGAAPARTCDLCPVFDRCGACSMLDVPYERQLARKSAYIAALFADIADKSAMRPIVGMDDPFHYRNKVISPYAPGKLLPASAGARRGGKDVRRREILTGMYAKGTHELVPVDACALENETAKKVTLVVRDLMRKWDIPPYDEDAGTGFMRHAVVRVGHTSGEVLVTLVTNQDEFPSSKSFCRELVRRVPAITSVVQNVNTRQTNVILGEKERVLYGPGFILDTLCGLSFRISSQSFYQVNATQTEVLYRTAIDLAELRGQETVVDAYCGTGTIGLAAAGCGAGRVIGVDNVESAIRDARQNAAHNGIENAEFQALDAGAFMQALAVQRRGQVEDADDLVLLMDPPRAGSTARFLDAAVELAPSRIVYISCNPATQARDAEYLARFGYEIDAIVPVDMFPHTDHIECVCRMRRV